MFETPHIEFDWKEIYLGWKEACEGYDFDSQVVQMLEYDFDSREGDIDIHYDYDWVPANSTPSQIGPKRTSVKGYSYYVPRAPKASELTLSLLMDNLDDEEVVAKIWILACALQLEIVFPPYWRGPYNASFLDDFVRFCRDNMGDRLKYEWGSNSKRIFPDKYFSRALLETVDILSAPNLTRLAALNAKYYLSEWIVVRYTIDGLSIDEYRSRRMYQAYKRMGFLSTDFPDANKEDEASAQRDNSDMAHGLKRMRPKVMVPGNRQSEFSEGGRKRTSNDAIERNAAARRACLEHYGPTCVVCGVNFEEAYGKEFSGIIDVHHIVPISQKDGRYLVDPVEDMVPLCPNCHRMIHRKKDGVYLPEELRRLIKESKGEG